MGKLFINRDRGQRIFAEGLKTIKKIVDIYIDGIFTVTYDSFVVGVRAV